MNRSLVFGLLCPLVLLVSALPATAQKVRLKDGRMLKGRMLAITGVADNPIESSDPGAPTKQTPILLVDDELRRVFVPKFALASVIDQAPEKMVKLNLSEWQNVARSGGTVGSVGPSLGITPFDAYGRRIYEMQTRNGPLAVVQGITELTPYYAKVEGLRGQPRSIVWDMRLATSSIPKETLAQILANAVSQDDPQDWLQVVRFYLQAGRHRDARLELEQLIRRFPEMQDLEAMVDQLRQAGARRVLEEITLRRGAGQYQLVDHLLANFPAEEVAGETLEQVRETLARSSQERARQQQVQTLLDTLVAQLKSDDHRRLIEAIVSEIHTDLSRHNLDRLVPFLQLADDASLEVEQRVALAITGWLLGGESASQKFSLAVSLVEVRTAVLNYLHSPLAHERQNLLDTVRSAEGAEVPEVAKLLMHMKPPWELEERARWGAYQLTAPGKTEHGDFPYLVQLPPEYDPYRRYPVLVVLNGANHTPEQALDFWAGKPEAAGEATGERRGQAMRHGYITLAIQWQKPRQRRYEYSLREHEAVLSSLRDATRHFSIDTDRVFLTGHGSGGDAAWDLAQSHPDLWAGVVPFVAQLHSQRKYVQHYWENAKYVSLYFVAGEKDGLKMTRNAEVLDKYFIKRFDTTVVEYLGRGHEPFYDEILQVFEWMGLPSHRRTGSPAEFSCSTMRPWDNFFWWIEGQSFPKEVYPEQWGQIKARPNTIACRIPSPNLLWAKTASARTTFWLSPDVVDFAQPIEIKLNGRKLTQQVRDQAQPDLSVLLEDVRMRADRIRPFWAKVEVP